MPIENNKLIREMQFVLYLALTALSFYGANLLLPPNGKIFQSLTHFVYLVSVVILVWAIVLYYNGVLQSARTKSYLGMIHPLLISVLEGTLLFVAALYVFKIYYVSRPFLLNFVFLNMGMFVLERTIFYVVVHNVRNRGYNQRNVLVVGTGERARSFADDVENNHKEWGINIAGFIDRDPSMVSRTISNKPVIGTIKDIPKMLTQFNIEDVYFICPRKWIDSMEDVVFLCEDMGLGIKIACDFYPKKISKINFDIISDWPMLSINPPPHYGDYFAVKRGIDFLFSLTVLVVISPLFLLIAAVIKLTSPGPVFFVQKRCGLKGKQLKVLKFRTMVENAEELKPTVEHLNEMSGPVFKSKEDPRITPVGRFLRKYSLDELPQFINVLRGDMSIVGPRPPLISEVNTYEYSQRRRLSVRPGITCLWQISGRNSIGFNDWVRLDLQYIDNWSLWLDMKIIIKTIPAVLRGTGV